MSENPTIEARTKELREAIAGMDLVASGMVSSRTIPCGKPTCRCAGNPDAYHGPYFQWHHCQDGRTVHKTITPDQVALMERAIANHREILRLLSIWEQMTVEAVLGQSKKSKC